MSAGKRPADDAPLSPPPARKKPKPAAPFVHRVCLCDGTDNCYQNMVKLWPSDPLRCGWIRLTKLSTSGSATAIANNRKRALVLRHLGAKAKARANDAEFSQNTVHYYSRTPLAMMGAMWGRERTTIGRYVDEWADRWGEAGESFSILPITEEDIIALCPKSYKEQGLDKVGAVPDGKDFMIDVPRITPLLTRASHSSKTHHASTRCISWSLPNGTSFEHTDQYMAKASEKALVELWGPRLHKVPAGYSMLSDRGFAGTERYYPNLNQQITPKFLAGRKQFTCGDVSDDRRICQLRYTCEVCFARVTSETSLKDVIPYPIIKHLDAISHWGHATVNLGAPLQY